MAKEKMVTKARDGAGGGSASENASARAKSKDEGLQQRSSWWWWRFSSRRRALFMWSIFFLLLSIAISITRFDSLGNVLVDLQWLRWWQPHLRDSRVDTHTHGHSANTSVEKTTETGDEQSKKSKCPLGYSSDEGLSDDGEKKMTHADIDDIQQGDAEATTEANVIDLFHNAHIFTGVRAKSSSESNGNDSLPVYACGFAVHRRSGRIVYVFEKGVHTSCDEAPEGDSGTTSDAVGPALLSMIDTLIAPLEGNKSAGVAIETHSLENLFVVPGFIDSHVHLMTGGRQLQQLALASIPEGKGKEGKLLLQRMVKDAYEKIKESESAKEKGSGGARTMPFILGHGWNEEIQFGDAWPTRHWLDEVSPDVPVWLTRMDLHCGVANTLALQLAGITEDTVHQLNENIDGGTIEVVTANAKDNNYDGKDEITGVIKENAMTLISSLIHADTESDTSTTYDIELRSQYIQSAFDYLLSLGITSVHDMGDIASGLGSTAADTIYNDIDILYTSHWDRYVRIKAAVPLSTWERLLTFKESFPEDIDHVKIGSVKTFIDGSLGSKTALFHEPYYSTSNDSDEDNRGLRLNDLSQIRANITKAHMNGFQSIVHAIGDHAIDDIIAIYEHTASVGSVSSVPSISPMAADNRSSSSEHNVNYNGVLRHRIEHVQHMSQPAKEIARQIAAAEVIASVQPLQIAYDQNVAERVLGVERATQSSYRLRTLRENGVRLAFGSDWPVVDADPIEAIFVAIERRKHGGSITSWLPEESLEILYALEAYTIDAAHGLHWEHDIGSLEVGKLADFAVVDMDIMMELSSLRRFLNRKQQRKSSLPKVLKTFVGGKCMYGCTAQA